MKTIYSPDMVANTGRLTSPSAGKPRLVAEALAQTPWPIEFVCPDPIAIDAIVRVHDVGFVDAILTLRSPDGFGSLSESVVRSLPYTCGGFHTGALIALSEGLSVSLTSGFHHAYPARARSYCTFNGLMISAVKLLDDSLASRVAIIDCDYHYGDGTDAIIEAMALENRILHVTFGKSYRARHHARAYLMAMEALRDPLREFRPDIVFYQAGADTHVDDPLGGLLTTDEMRTRDRTMFAIARDLGIPLTWNLAGGYQMAQDGSIPIVIDLHLNTFAEALREWQLI
ncbi:MAG TPA: hypothetical protein VJT73_19350 [Polyangiaceae bacterium]|nr:hypothetical protein [Polyangiaceae bacterium]